MRYLIELATFNPWGLALPVGFVIWVALMPLVDSTEDRGAGVEKDAQR